MKTQKFSFLRVAILSAVVIVVAAFAKPAPVKYAVDAKASSVLWKGKKVTGEHSGAVPISAGELFVDGKKLTQGKFEFNLASLTVTDIQDPESNAKLVGHLKNQDFFNTSAYPKASFVISSVTPVSGDQYTVKGNLTIKNITKEIDFPATIKTDGKKLTANAKIIVDRTKFDIRYGSTSFFDNLGDKAIYNDFELDVNLVATNTSGI